MTGSRSKVHPYQDQVNRMHELIKRQKIAGKGGFWIEHLALSYMLLEIQLRLLMTKKARPSRQPLSRKVIDRERNLWDLTILADREKFIDSTIKEKIRDFIKRRDKAIHRLAYGEITYDELRDPSYSIGNLIFDIQNLWLPIKFGPLEKAPKLSK